VGIGSGSGSGGFWLPARGARFAHRTRPHPPIIPWSLLVLLPNRNPPPALTPTTAPCHSIEPD